MNDIQARIQELAREHLPDAVAGEMKVFLAEAENTQKALVEANVVIDSMNVNYRELSVEHKKLEDRVILQESLDVRAAECDRRVLEVEKGERNLALLLAAKDISSLKEQIASVTDLVRIVFSAPSVTVERRVTGSIPLAVEGGNNSYGGAVVPGNIETTETTKTTHAKS